MLIVDCYQIIFNQNNDGIVFLKNWEIYFFITSKTESIFSTSVCGKVGFIFNSDRAVAINKVEGRYSELAAALKQIETIVYLLLC